MELKEVKIEFVDPESRLVLKKIITDKGEYLNHKIAVSNSLFSCERKRVLYGKSMFLSWFQTYHIRWDYKFKEWDFLGLEGAYTHSLENQRIFFPFKQRNEEQMNNLTWQESDNDYDIFVKRYNLKYVPYAIPLNATVEEWKAKKESLEELDKTRIIIPIISTKHNIEHFPGILLHEFKNSNMIGLVSYELTNVVETINLSITRKINSNGNIGDKSCLIVNLGFPRILSRHAYVSGAFAFSCFAGDIFSEKAYFIKNMSREAILQMMSKKPEDYYFYDPIQKGFNKSSTQLDWYGKELTRNDLSKISLDEGLEGYHAINWMNQARIQKDFNDINEKLIEKSNIVNYLRDNSRWGVFWDLVVDQSNIKKKID